MAANPAVRVGTSGFHYAHWRGVFYPRGLSPSRWFEHYSRYFDTVEINNSFYRLPAAETFAAWRKQAPPGFLYAVKFSRYGTHMKRLTDPRGPQQQFLAAAKHLRSTLGPILVQLPPRWKANPERLEKFLAIAPRRFRWTVEFRDPSWLTEEVYRVLRTYGAALCLHDIIPDHPDVVTADWTYLRYHGDRSHQGNYDRAALRAQARRIGGYLDRGLDVYAYFNNDARGYAVENALELRSLLGAEPIGAPWPQAGAGAARTR